MSQYPDQALNLDAIPNVVVRSFGPRADQDPPDVAVFDAQAGDDPSGRLMETIYAGFDQYESDMNGYRTTAAMHENARRGFVNGSKAPLLSRRTGRRWLWA